MSKNNSSKKAGAGATAVKVIAVLFALILAAYVVLSLVYHSWNPVRWTDTKQTQPATGDTGNEPGDDNPDDPDDGNFAGDLVNPDQEHGISLMSSEIAVEDYAEYGIDAQADTAYTITATVNSDAEDKSVIGSISWANSSSSWANGKKISDYAELNQTTQYGLEFRLTVKQAFGEPIVVKVASMLDSSVYGTSNVNYLKTVSSFTATMNPSVSSSAAGRLYVGNNTVQINPVYGVGTVTGTVSACSTVLTLNDFTKNGIQSSLANSGAGGTRAGSSMSFTGLTFNIQTGHFLDVSSGGNIGVAMTLVNNFICKYGCGDSTGSSASTAGVSSIKYSITYSYGNSYSVALTYTDNVGYGFRPDGLTAVKTITSINTSGDIVVIPN